jgi:rod shape-determining protein MreC
MASRVSIGQVASSLRSVAQRFAFALLVVGAFGIMVIGKADTVIVERIRSAIGDVVSPVLNVLSRPVQTVNDLMADAQDLVTLRSELTRLREENARLLSWQNVAQRLEAENKALRSFLNYQTGPQATFITARVVGDAGSAFVRSMLLSSGARDHGCAPRRGGAIGGIGGRMPEMPKSTTRTNSMRLQSTSGSMRTTPVSEMPETTPTGRPAG